MTVRILSEMQSPSGLIHIGWKSSEVFLAVHEFENERMAQTAFDALGYSRTMSVLREQHFLYERPHRVCLIGRDSIEVGAAGIRLADMGGRCLNPLDGPDADLPFGPIETIEYQIEAANQVLNGS